LGEYLSDPLTNLIRKCYDFIGKKRNSKEHRVYFFSDESAPVGDWRNKRKNAGAAAHKVYAPKLYAKGCFVAQTGNLFHCSGHSG
jgi:hypothetical protein